MTIGVLALQGGVEEHVKALQALGFAVKRVCKVEDFEGLEGLVIPGGESTVMLKFIQAYALAEPIADLVQAGKPVYGTCAGLIVLARLGLLRVEVERNAYGRQLASFVAPLLVRGLDEGFPAHFIRAPKVSRVGEGVQVLAGHDGVPVLVRQGNVWASSFHPELSEDLRLHEMIFSC